MAETIKTFITSIFNNNPWLATFIIAMLPIFELRGAIPFGMSTQIWGVKALTSAHSFFASLLATTLIIPLIAIIFIPTINYLKNTKHFKTLAQKFENRIKTKTPSIINHENNKLKKLLSIFMFVAIPLPLTGVYTGTCIAVMAGLNFYEILLSVGTGNLVAGILTLLISTIFKNNTIIVIVGFIILTISIILFGYLIKKLKHIRPNN